MENKILRKITVVVLLLAGAFANAQNVAINSTGAAPNSSAVLDLSANTAGGLLLPYMNNAQMLLLSPTASNSLLIYNSTVNCIEAYYTGTASWQPIFCPCSAAPSATGAPSGTE